MTPIEYQELKQFKPLTPNELQEGKDKLTFYGSTTLIPWTDIYVRIQAGQPMEDLVEIYGNERKITLWAINDAIGQEEVIKNLFDAEIGHRRAMNEIEKKAPEVAQTLKELVNEYAPDVTRDALKLSQKLIDKASTVLDGDDLTSSDVYNIAQAYQKIMDTNGISQRHANAAQTSINTIRVEGFSFIEDLGPNDDIITITQEESTDE